MGFESPGSRWKCSSTGGEGGGRLLGCPASPSRGDGCEDRREALGSWKAASFSLDGSSFALGHGQELRSLKVHLVSGVPVADGSDRDQRRVLLVVVDHELNVMHGHYP